MDDALTAWDEARGETKARQLLDEREHQDRVPKIDPFLLRQWFNSSRPD